MTALDVAPQVGIAAACIGLGVARATFYRAQRPVSARQPRAPSRNKSSSVIPNPAGLTSISFVSFFMAYLFIAERLISTNNSQQGMSPLSIPPFTRSDHSSVDGISRGHGSVLTDLRLHVRAAQADGFK